MDQEEDIEEKIRTSTFVIDYYDWIEGEFEKKPPKKNKKQRKEWLDEINRLITECNKLTKLKVYNLQE